MNWEEFSKPTWKKIIIFVIFVAVSFLLYIYSSGMAGSEPNQLGQLLGYIFMALNWPLVLYSRIFNISRTDILYFGVFIDGLWFYIFSCTIAWICNKVKKR